MTRLVRLALIRLAILAAVGGIGGGAYWLLCEPCHLGPQSPLHRHVDRVNGWVECQTRRSPTDQWGPPVGIFVGTGTRELPGNLVEQQERRREEEREARR